MQTQQLRKLAKEIKLKHKEKAVKFVDDALERMVAEVMILEEDPNFNIFAMAEIENKISDYNTIKEILLEIKDI